MTKKSGGYQDFAAAVSSGELGRLYILHGEERYLLERSLAEIRKRLCPDGIDSFNYKRYEGRDLLPGTLEDAVNTMPAFAEKTLVEIHDFDIFKSADEQKQRTLDTLSDLPDYVCVLFVYDTVPYKPDGRVKLNAAILKCAQVIEFTIQPQDKLVKWIIRRVHSAGKRISAPDAEYLAFITGGYMASLIGEIEKISAYAKDETVTRRDIDSVVTPVLDAVAYKLTDAIVRRGFAEAMRILDELLRMREAPHKLMFGISLKMRQLLAARICAENGHSAEKLAQICAIRHPFQARSLMESARKTTLAQCKSAVLACSETALALNSRPDPEASIIELIIKLAHLS